MDRWDSMAQQGRCQILEVAPQQAWDGLKNDKSSVLIDVRTRAEWGYVGIPDLQELDRNVILSEWRTYPTMQVNADFLTEVMEQLGGEVPDNLYFLCRSGVRSLDAAHVMADALDKQGKVANCINVVNGFEGDMDENRQRGHVNGWKVQGLPWLQS